MVYLAGVYGLPACVLMLYKWTYPELAPRTLQSVSGPRLRDKRELNEGGTLVRAKLANAPPAPNHRSEARYL